MRKKILFSIMFSAVLTLMVLNIPALTVHGEQDKVAAVFQASADSYADQENPNSSHGGVELLKVRSSEAGNARTYVFFNISTIPPGASVLRAKLLLYLSKKPASNRTYLCYHLTSAWDEGSLAWSKRPESTSTFAASSIVPTNPGWVVWDVTDQVQKFLNGIEEYAWRNLGWEILDGSENSPVSQEAWFLSRESLEQDKRPFLTVEFIPPKLNITVSNPLLVSGEWAGITIKRLSQDGILVIRGDRIFKQDWISFGSTIVKLSTSSRTGIFSLSPGGEPVDRVEIRNGETQIVVYYYDTSVGDYMISAVAEGYSPDYYVEGSAWITVIVDTYPPQIVNVSRSPDTPVMGEVIKVSAWITDVGTGVKEVILYYSTDGGASWSRITMSRLADRYDAYIPGQNAFTEVLFYVEASDKNGNTAKSEVAKVSVRAPEWVFLTVAALILIMVVGLLLVRRSRKK
jgi:hypothetical protein